MIQIHLLGPVGFPGDGGSKGFMGDPGTHVAID